MGKNVVSLVFVSVLLLSVFAVFDVRMVGTGGLATAEASSEIYFTLEATVTENPYWGLFGGYHGIWEVIKPELAKIGINLTINQYDDSEWYARVWEDGWNKTGDEGGWDMTMMEWRLQPHAPEPWFTSLVAGWADPWPLPEGRNICDWNNTKADELLYLGMTSFDAADRQYYLWRWQEEFMHDPPIAEIYYPRIYEARASYVLGYDPVGVRWYDPKHLDINVTEFERTVGPSGFNPNPDRYADGNDTIFYAVTEDVWGWSPMYMCTHTEENFGTLCYDTLYTWSLNYTDEEWLTAGIVEPDLDDYIILPELAADYPTVLDGGLRMRVPLREDVLWSDQDPTHPRAGQPFNATDVKFTFDCTFNPEVACTGLGDFAYAIESVEVVPDPVNGTWDPYTDQLIDPYLVDFILKFPHPDFTSLISNDWGGGSIIPWTQAFENLVRDHPTTVDQDQTNTQWNKMHPGTGPFTVTGYSVPENYIKLERNDLHWGYDLGYGPHVSTIFLMLVPEANTRLLQIQDNDIDLGEYPTASVEEYQDMMTWENIRVFQYDYPASNGVWFNLDNQYLSNRYVRQAICHAIPCGYIIDNILPEWGIETAYRGKTSILPQHYYEGVGLFNEVLPAYEYNITKAQEYMDMWKYSQPLYAPVGSPEVDLGPVGDADFSGRVNFDDLWVWRENFGKSPAEWPWIPGCDVDPDFNNNDAVDTIDFAHWGDSWGHMYPGDHGPPEYARARATVSPYIGVVPESTIDPTLTIDMNYTVSIYTDYTESDVWGYEFELTYNPDVLNVVEVTNGDLITEDVDPTLMWFPGGFDNTAGTLSLTGSGFNATPGESVPVTSAPGTLANITFTVVGTGTSNITLEPQTRLIGYDSIMDESYDIIDATIEPDHIQHGYFRNKIPGDVAVLGAGPARMRIPDPYFGTTIPVVAVVMNNGTATETFNVSIFYDTTLIGNSTVTLDAGATEAVSFDWDLGALPEGAYTISANASIVPGETDTADNYFLDGQVRKTFDGEVTADGIVDASDLLDLSKAYGSTTLSEDVNSDGKVDFTDFGLWYIAYGTTDPYADIDGSGFVDISDYFLWGAAFGQTGSPNWNPYADMNADNKIDALDLFDLSTHWGDTYP